MNEEAREIQKHKTGWKKRAGLMALFLIVAFGGFVWLVMPPAEPSYQGKPLSYWLSRYEEIRGTTDDEKDPKVIECRDAVHHIGTNAIPTLLRMLRAKDSRLRIGMMNLVEKQNFIHIPFSTVQGQEQKAETGFYLLGDLASNAVPALIDFYAHPSSDYSKEIAGSTLMQLYPAQGTAIPNWLPAKKWAQWYMDVGLVKSQSGATSNALLAFSQAIKLNPTNSFAYLGSGGVKIDLQDFAGAMTDIDKVLELSPSNETAFFYRGLCKFSLKDFKSAEADFTKAINLETNMVRFYNYRSLANANLRKLDAARADCNKAIEMAPGDSESYRNRASVESLQREYESALADASKAIELDSHDATAYTCRGRVENALKDYQAALADFDRAIELNPKDSAAYTSRGMASTYLDDFSSATADLDKAMQLNPKNATAFLVRGVLEAKRGEDDAALADFEHAVELAPQVPEARGMLGMFQYKVSQWKPALANCRKALQLGAVASASDSYSYIWLIRAQSGEKAAANQELEDYLKTLDGSKTNEWNAVIVRFFTGGVPESNFLNLATTSAKRPSAVKVQICESLYYAGMKRKLAGDKAGAMELFQKCLDTKYDNAFAYLNAGAEMRAMKRP